MFLPTQSVVAVWDSWVRLYGCTEKTVTLTWLSVCWCIYLAKVSEELAYRRASKLPRSRVFTEITNQCFCSLSTQFLYLVIILCFCLHILHVGIILLVNMHSLMLFTFSMTGTSTLEKPRNPLKLKFIWTIVTTLPSLRITMEWQKCSFLSVSGGRWCLW